MVTSGRAQDATNQAREATKNARRTAAELELRFETWIELTTLTDR
jgi:hypothetical protein